MDSEKFNKEAWDKEVLNNNWWTKIVSEDEIEKIKKGEGGIRITTTKNIPPSWLELTKGKKTLSLCAGGGQQTPLLSSYGSIVTSLDISPRQIQQDREALDKFCLKAETVVGSVLEMPFENESFDVIVNPISLNFVPSLDKAYSEIDRVLKNGGYFMMGIANPVLYIFDEKKQNKRLRVKYTLPFSTESSLSKREIERKIKENDTFEYSHTLESIIRTILKRGFVLLDFFSDMADSEPTDSFINDSFLAFLFKKIVIN